mmetsp:Transcript_14278/g.38280  ORF Transcript_14278/g.38280 Transcript_14278/m.38280 type:complete len:215 (-) Transcript_14278:698-1342(-)
MRLRLSRACVVACKQICSLFEQLASNQHPANFAGASSDLVQLGVSQQASAGVVVRVPVSSERLYRLECCFGCSLCGVQNYRRTILAVERHAVVTFSESSLFGAIARCSDRVNICSTRSKICVHIRKLCLHELKLANAAAKLASLDRVGQRNVKAGLHDAQRPCREHQAFRVEARHEHVCAATDSAENVLFWDKDVVEHELARGTSSHAKLVELL